jgi:hypothetical protein
MGSEGLLATISAKALDCLEELALISSRPEHVNVHVFSFKNDANVETQRFHLWVANLGVLSPGHSSLDYRLRDAESVRLVVEKLLKGLIASTSEGKSFELARGVLTPCKVLDIAKDVRLPLDQAKPRKGDATSKIGEDWRDESSSSSEDGDSQMLGKGNENNSGLPTELQMLFEDVADSITALYRLATQIRNSSLRSQPGDRQFFADYTAEQQKTIMHQLIQIETRLIERHVSESIQDIDANQRANPEDQEILHKLIWRLSRANTIRRQQFTYWREQRDKKERAISKLERPRRSFMPQHQRLVDNARLPPVERLIPETATVAPSVPSSATKLDVTRMKPAAPSSIYSRVSRAPPAEGPGGKKPPWPPVNELPSGEYFECPYCFLLCPQKYRLNQEAWK